MEERKPLVSVIVPVYNVYPYLRDCVQSVQAQSYQNWELLLVDDGSTDGSGELCDELAVEDGRIRVFHKPNGGLSDARNHGMHHARGEYFCFLDSDDLLPENALEKLVGLCEQHRADVAMGQLLQFETEPQRQTGTTGGTEILTVQDTIRGMLLRKGKIGHTACAKLFRRELWAELRFPKGMLYEDYAVIYKVMQGCRTVVADYEPLYYYRMRGRSIMHEPIQEKNLVLLDIAQDVTQHLSRTMPEVREEAEYLQLVTYLKTLKRILNSGFDCYPEAQEQILRFVREHRDLTRRSWAKRADRIKVETLMKGRGLFYLIYTLAEIKNNHAV